MICIGCVQRSRGLSVVTNNKRCLAVPTYQSPGTDAATTLNRWADRLPVCFDMLLNHQTLTLFAIQKLGHLA